MPKPQEPQSQTAAQPLKSNANPYGVGPEDAMTCGPLSRPSGPTAKMASWSVPRCVTTSFDPSQWGVPSGSSFRPFVGDYNGITSLSDRAVLTWTGPGPGGQPYNLEILTANVLR